MIEYRRPKLSEADKFWEMMNALDGETKFMLYEPNERPKNSAPQCRYIKAAEENRAFVLAAFDRADLVGYVTANRGGTNRSRHSAYIVIGIRKAYQGKGIGSRLFAELTDWAEKQKITRLELTVICGNEKGLALYKKFGFEIEGIKRDSLIIDGEYVDEYYMAKILK